MRRTLLMAVVILASVTAAEATDGPSIFAGGGYVKPSDVDGAAYFTAGARIGLGEQVAVEPELGYWSKSEGVQDFLRGEVSDTLLGASLVFVPETEGILGFYLGAGPAVHFVDGTFTFLGVSKSETRTKLGGQVFAGLDIEVSEPVWIFVTARYDLVSKIGDVDVGGFKAFGGVRINF